MRQQEYVDVAKDPDVHSFEDVGKLLGVTRQTAREVLTRPYVAEFLNCELEKQRDKAGALLRKIERATEKMIDRIEKGEVDDPARAMAGLKAGLETVSKIQESQPDTETDTERLFSYHKAMKRALELGSTLPRDRVDRLAKVAVKIMRASQSKRHLYPTEQESRHLNLFKRRRLAAKKRR